MKSDMRSLFKDLADELGDESTKKQTPAEKTLHEVAQRLLTLERDLKTPGATRSVDERVDRILETIAKEKF